MTHSVDRRGFLMTVAGGAAAATLGVLPPARARARATPIGNVKLTDNLTLFTGDGANVLAARDTDGLALVDGGLTARSHELLRSIRRATGLHRVHTLFNTHWHPCQTGSNEPAGKEHATIIAHENTRLWFGQPIWSQWQHRHFPPRPKSAWPTETFYTSGKLTFAGEPVEYGYLGEAHTDGDLYVYFRGQNVLVPGCVLAVDRYPIIDYSTNGWLGGMAAATARLARMIDERTRIVPGVGPLQTRADLLAEHAMLADLQSAIWHLMLKGYGIPDILAAHPTARYDAHWGDPNLFVNAAFHSLYAHCREIRGAI